MVVSHNAATYAARLLADGFYFAEGPRWRDGRLFISDMYDHRVLSLSADGHCRLVCRTEGEPSGLGWTPEGDLLVVSMADRRVLRLRDGLLTPHADLSGATPFPCNDMLVEHDGRIWLGNFGFDFRDDATVNPASLFRIDPDGTVHEAATDLVFPNGMVVTSDGRLLVAETWAFKVTSFRIGIDGSLSDRQTLIQFRDSPARTVADILDSSAFAPDGLCLDAEGGLWVGSATGGGPIHLTPDGTVDARVDLGSQTAFAVALGGESGRTLFMCVGPPMGTADLHAARQGSIWITNVEAPAAAPR